MSESNTNENPIPKREPGVNGRPKAGTPDWKPGFLALVASGVHARDAAHEVGINPSTPYHARRDDEEFRVAWEQAVTIGTKELEREAARRAFHGTLKPVFHAGTEVGKVREYSDTLLIFLLKGRKPQKYRDNARVELTGADGKAISIQTVENIERDRIIGSRN